MSNITIDVKNDAMLGRMNDGVIATKLYSLEKKIEDLQHQLEQKENIIKEVREYIEKDTRWFDSEYAKTYGELCTCAGANDTRLEVLVNPSNILEILDKAD